MNSCLACGTQIRNVPMIGSREDSLCQKIIEMGRLYHTSRVVSSAVVQLDGGDTAAEFQGKGKNSPEIHVLLFSCKIYTGVRESQTDRCINIM